MAGLWTSFQEARALLPEDDTATTLTRALDLAGDSTLPQFLEARETLSTLPTPDPQADPSPEL